MAGKFSVLKVLDQWRTASRRGGRRRARFWMEKLGRAMVAKHTLQTILAGFFGKASGGPRQRFLLFWSVDLDSKHSSRVNTPPSLTPA
jgi:hypothetical protein